MQFDFSLYYRLSVFPTEFTKYPILSALCGDYLLYIEFLYILGLIFKNISMVSVAVLFIYLYLFSFYLDMFCHSSLLLTHFQRINF